MAMYGRRHWLHYLKAKIVRGDWMTKDRATISLDQFFNYIGDQIAPKRKKKKNQGATNTMCNDKSGLEA